MTTLTLDQRMLQNCQEELKQARDEIHRLKHQHANDECANRMLAIGSARYEAIRKLNPRQFSELYARNIGGENFDAMIDALSRSPHTIQVAA